MEYKTIMRALFAQQRAQIIEMKASGNGVIDDAYALAWIDGMYPYYHDEDSSVPQKPHENFKEFFIISGDFVKQVVEFLDEKWLKNNSPTFYELEDKFGGKNNRSKLITICRYCYMKRMFDDKLWKALITPMKFPSEAGNLTSSLDENELWL
ncbi:MAG: hypothetical protein ACRBEE_12360 [Arenicella sp.]